MLRFTNGRHNYGEHETEDGGGCNEYFQHDQRQDPRQQVCGCDEECNVLQHFTEAELMHIWALLGWEWVLVYITQSQNPHAFIAFNLRITTDTFRPLWQTSKHSSRENQR